jgi:hypothetical protein
MPTAADPARPGGGLLLDDDGAVLARFVEGTRDGRPLADLVALEPGAGVERTAERILRELGGWKVAGDEDLGRALIALGAQPARHARVRSRDLRRDPAPAGWAEPATPAGVRIGPLDRPAAELAAMYEAAYPPEHADWRYTGPPADYATDLADLLDGRIAGPRLALSRLATTAAGEPAGVLLVTELDEPPPFGGAWVAELFRRQGPELRGTGRALLQSGLAAATAAGRPAIGLAVSDGNPAERLYASLGFAVVLRSISVVVPG